jgi:hypothetical protein
MNNSADTYYAVLGVAETATLEEIRSAYRTLLKKIHPDTVATLSPGLRREAEDVTQEMNEAYSVLADPVQRSRYDCYLATERQRSTDSGDSRTPATRAHFSAQSIPVRILRTRNIRWLEKTTASRKEGLAIATLTILVLGVFCPFLIWIVTIDGNNSVLSFAGFEFTFILSQIWLGSRTFKKAWRKGGTTGWVSGILISVLLNAFYTIVALVLLLSLPDQDLQETGQRLLGRAQCEFVIKSGG